MELGSGKEVVKHFQQPLLVQLTDGEVVERQEGLVQALKHLDEAEGAKKTAVEAFNENIKTQRGHIAHEVVICDERKEIRSVKCVEYNDLETMNHCVMRVDTGEVLTTRAMTAQERQANMDFMKT